MHKIGHNAYHMHHIFIFAAIVVFSFLAISNLLPTFSRDVAMATKLNLLYVNLVKTPVICTAYSIFWICWWTSDQRFLLCYWNLQERLPWQLNFGFHSQSCTKLSITPIICTILSLFSAVVVFLWSMISNSLPMFSRDVAMATKLWIYSINFVKTPVVCTAYSIFFNLLAA